MLIDKITCFLFGHHGGGRPCRCGADILNTDGSYTHVRHNLVCFFGGHRYRLAGTRNEHNEYVCIQCGHPLLIGRKSDDLPSQGIFKKYIHYSCGPLGHRVHQVGNRDGLHEYACYCGHSFLKQQAGLSKIRHPWICLLSGHSVWYLGRRFGQAEFLCRNCGHPFYFGSPESTSDTNRTASQAPLADARGSVTCVESTPAF
jgi:DNA-directed RNA polymerase subunit RPC12/RpoP